MKLHTESYLKHANHEMVIDTNPRAHHIAALRCKKCDKHIKWLSKSELESIQSIMASNIMAPTEGVKARPVRNQSARTL